MMNEQVFFSNHLYFFCRIRREKKEQITQN